MNKQNYSEIIYAGVSLNFIYENIKSRSSAVKRNEHRKFLAARKIQALYKGWKVRQNIAKLHFSATTIQRFWRGYLGRRKFYNHMMEVVQQQIEAHYTKSAIRIQSYWRGYWSRQHIHDHFKLQRFQMRAAKDLVHCVAFKLHHLLRTRQIPGIYSLRNSRCLSKVEKLLASLRFKEYNASVRNQRKEHLRKVADGAKKAHLSKQFTEVPFEGPAVGGGGGDECGVIFNMKDADRKMFKILDIYEKKSKEEIKHRKQAQKSRKQNPSTHPPSLSMNECDFCSKVVESMKRWKIVNEGDLIVGNDVGNTLDNVEKFVDDVHSMCDLISK